MISLAEVVNDPDFAQPFSIARSQGGDFAENGVWVDVQVTVPMYGIIKPATAKEILQVPEGDRVKEVKSVHSSQEMRVTHVDDDDSGLSDIVTWPTTGEQYKLVYLYPWQDFGYYRALGVRISGA